MTDQATIELTPEDKEKAKKAKRAKAERDRRAKKAAEAKAAEATPTNGRVPKDPEAKAIAVRAKEIAPGIKSPYQPFEVRSLMTIVGDADPIEFTGVPAEALDGRNVRDVINAWALGELETADPAAKALRARVREIKKDPRAKNIWGRKYGALILAIDEAR